MSRGEGYSGWFFGPSQAFDFMPNMVILRERFQLKVGQANFGRNKIELVKQITPDLLLRDHAFDNDKMKLLVIGGVAVEIFEFCFHVD